MTTKRCLLVHADAFEWLPKRKGMSIHAVVTDPPYGIIEYLPDQLTKQRNGKGGIWRLPKTFDGQSRGPMPRFTVLGPNDLARIRDFHATLSPMLYRVFVPGGHVIVASHNLFMHLVASEFLKSGFELRGQIVRVVKTLRGGDRPKGGHLDFPEVSVSPRSCWEPWIIFRRPCEGTVRDNLASWWTGGLRRTLRDLPFSDLIYSPPARGVEREVAPHPSLKPQAFMRQVV